MISNKKETYLARRVIALVLDWAIASLISYLFFSYHPLVTLAIFFVEQVLLVATVNKTLGHFALGLMVVPNVSEEKSKGPAPLYIGFYRAFIRALLLCLVIPAVVWDENQLGLHDRSAGTRIVFNR